MRRDVNLVTLAVPCRTDEPALGRMLMAAANSWSRGDMARTHALEVLVCLNGADALTSPALAQLGEFARGAGTPLETIDVDASTPPTLPARHGPRTVVALLTRRAGKPVAWNALRQCARGALGIVVDADVWFAPEAFALLLDTLVAHPDAALASPKTTCAPRPTAFERVMAVPYQVDFPNLSGQLYAARWAALPPAMPDDLIEPERWLELVVGRARVVRVPEARVVVRLPGTFGDFFRQRVRIEMGKIQIAREYPGLAARGTAQPRGRAALASLGAAGLARLAVYLVLRSGAHGLAWWRYRRGATGGIWRQAPSTKRWDTA
jgi:hypothetical protein